MNTVQNVSSSISTTCLPKDHVSYDAEFDVRKLIKPLQKLGGIEYFCYGINYPDTTGYTLHTNAKYYESWFAHEGTLQGFYLKSGWYLIENYTPSEVMKTAHEQDIGNFLSYIEHQNDKTIIFEFGTRPDNKNSFEFYKNNLELLKRFGEHFVNSLAQNIISKAETQRIKPYQFMTKEIGPSKNEAIFDVEAKNSFPYEMLTEKEKCYLKYMLQGYTNNEIGFDLNISPKTIFKHISKMKKKLNCSSKSEVFSKATNDGAVQYFCANPLYESSHFLTQDESTDAFIKELYFPVSKLSQQEYACYKLVLRGYTLAEISDELGIQIPTVAAYVERLKHKVGASSKVDLFKHAIENGFMQINPKLAEVLIYS